MYNLSPLLNLKVSWKPQAMGRPFSALTLVMLHNWKESKSLEVFCFLISKSFDFKVPLLLFEWLELGSLSKIVDAVIAFLRSVTNTDRVYAEEVDARSWFVDAVLSR